MASPSEVPLGALSELPHPWPAVREPRDTGPEPSVPRLGRLRPRAGNGLSWIVLGLGSEAGAGFVPRLSVRAEEAVEPCLAQMGKPR